MAKRIKISSLTLVIPVLVLAVSAQLEIWSRPLEGPQLLLAVLALIYSFALLAARIAPLPAFATCLVAISVMAITAPEATNEAAAPMFAGLAGTYLVARHGSRDVARGGLGLAVAVLLLVASDQTTLGNAVVTFVTSMALVGVCWGIGRSLHSKDDDAVAAEQRATIAEASRESAARLAVAEERTRIARELHDIVAHAVSKMVLRAGAVRHNLPDELVDDKEALQDVELAGREALTEMRSLLGAMRSSDDAGERAPQPDLGDLDSLINGIRESGLAAELEIDGEPRALPPAMELSAYRIVQEGLTNVLKHSHANNVKVSVLYGDDALAIEVRDDGIGAGEDDGLGHGLVGIRERVLVYGGEMSAGREANGGYLLSSRLPIETALA